MKNLTKERIDELKVKLTRTFKCSRCGLEESCIPVIIDYGNGLWNAV